jgi:drug/metabolite transporter (DMT)-like permease
MFPIGASAVTRLDPFTLTAFRYGVATLIFLALLKAFEGNVGSNRHKELFVIGSIGFAGFNLLCYLGLEHTEPQNAALIVALQPLITALGLWLVARQVPTRHTFTAMAIALFGVTLVITKGQPGNLLHGDGHGGELLMLLGCICWVVYTLGARRFTDHSPLRYTALTAAYGTLTVFAITAVVAVTGGTHVDVGGGLWWQLPYIILIGSVLAVLAWNAGVSRIGPANGALFMNLVPVISFAIAIAIQGYAPDGWELLGAGVTIAALVYANLRGRALAPRAHPLPGGARVRAAQSA